MRRPQAHVAWTPAWELRGPLGSAGSKLPFSWRIVRKPSGPIRDSKWVPGAFFAGSHP